MSAYSAEQEIQYTYDALGRLTFVEDSLNGNRDYDFDKAGNRTEVIIGNAEDEVGDTGPTSCRSVISSPVYPCSSSRNWAYGEYQYCTSMENTHSCVW